jgi:hypothetical protein
VILFAIDCSPSMLELYDDPENEGTQTSHLLVALDAAVQIQKKKAIVGPNDSVGIIMFNTVRVTIPIHYIPTLTAVLARHDCPTRKAKALKLRRERSCFNLFPLFPSRKFKNSGSL